MGFVCVCACFAAPAALQLLHAVLGARGSPISTCCQNAAALPQYLRKSGAARSVRHWHAPHAAQSEREGRLFMS